MLNGVKKNDRLQRTIDGVINSAHDDRDLIEAVVEAFFKDKSEEEMSEWWELDEDLDAHLKGENGAA